MPLSLFPPRPCEDLLLPALAGEQKDLTGFRLAPQKMQGQAQTVVVEHDERVVEQNGRVLPQQQMADGKLDRLRRRLEEIHKEELEDGYDTAGVA